MNYGRQMGDVSFRYVLGLVVVLWGVSLALQGLGFHALPLAHWINVYWPVPLMLWGLFGIVERLVKGYGGPGVYVVVLVVSAVIQISNLHIGHVNGWTVLWAALVLAAGVEMLRRPHWRTGSWRRHGYGIGDLDVGPNIRWENGRHGRHESHLIGDMRVDLTDMNLGDGETPFELSALIGDITILVPEGLPVSVIAEVTVGDVRVFERHVDGVGRRLTYLSPGYEEATRKARIYAHLLIGDVTVRKF